MFSTRHMRPFPCVPEGEGGVGSTHGRCSQRQATSLKLAFSVHGVDRCFFLYLRMELHNLARCLCRTAA